MFWQGKVILLGALILWATTVVFFFLKAGEPRPEEFASQIHDKFQKSLLEFELRQKSELEKQTGLFRQISSNQRLTQGLVKSILEEIHPPSIQAPTLDDEEPQPDQSGAPPPQFPYGPNTMTRRMAPPGIAVLLFTHSRAESLKDTLDSFFAIHPENGFPLFISQDGDFPAVSDLINQYNTKQQAIHLRFEYQEEEMISTVKKNLRVYYRIAQHFGWALHQIFTRFRYQKCIIIEDDMKFAPDFFNYFSSLAPLLDEDPTLLCISAWNDNGQSKFVHDPSALYRTDCFPGLGWMMSRYVWEDISQSWPLGFWDDWLREPQTRAGRSCIFPEISRTYTFGSKGASKGQHFKRFLATMRLNDRPIDFREQDIEFLIKANYDEWLRRIILDSPRVKDWPELAGLLDRTLNKTNSDSKNDKSNDYVFVYTNLDHLTNLQKHIGLLADKRETPRSSYDGVIIYRRGIHRIFLTPERYLQEAYQDESRKS